jgi:hypothetical protein
MAQTSIPTRIPGATSSWGIQRSSAFGNGAASAFGNGAASAFGNGAASAFGNGAASTGRALANPAGEIVGVCSTRVKTLARRDREICTVTISFEMCGVIFLERPLRNLHLIPLRQWYELLEGNNRAMTDNLFRVEYVAQERLISAGSTTEGYPLPAGHVERNLCLLIPAHGDYPALTLPWLVGQEVVLSIIRTIEAYHAQPPPVEELATIQRFVAQKLDH